MRSSRWYVPVLLLALAGSIAILPLGGSTAAPLPAGGKWSASYATNGQPTTFVTGSSPVSYTITLTDTGSGSWSSSGSNAVHLSVRFSTAGGGYPASQPWINEQRYTLPNDVSSGQSVTLKLAVTPPSSPGNYVLEYQVIQGSSNWFAQYLDSSVTVTNPPTSTATSTDTPTSTATSTATPTATATSTSTPKSTATPAATDTPAPTCPVAPISGTSYSYVSAPGDYIGQGACNTYSPSGSTITMSGTASYLTMTVSSGTDYWTINLAAPSGEALHPATYYNAERASFRTGRAPGLDVSGDGRGCNDVYGSFAINQIATDSSGNVTLLDATFTQNCESSTAPPLQGIVHYQMQPLSYAFVSDSGDYIGQGVTKSYAGATTIFGLSGSLSNLTFTVSGLRDTWTVQLVAPSGQQLVAGTTYSGATRAPFQGSGPGLSVSGDGRGCNTLTGDFTINAIQADGQGNVTALDATFDQHCEGATAALHGTINDGA